MSDPEQPLTPGEALAKLFLDNADRGANAANDELIVALLDQARVDPGAGYCQPCVAVSIPTQTLRARR